MCGGIEIRLFVFDHQQFALDTCNDITKASKKPNNNGKDLIATIDNKKRKIKREKRGRKFVIPNPIVRFANLCMWTFAKITASVAENVGRTSVKIKTEAKPSSLFRLASNWRGSKSNLNRPLNDEIARRKKSRTPRKHCLHALHTYTNGLE